jgi:proteasome lid subunit RPN8/RPN11
LHFSQLHGTIRTGTRSAAIRAISATRVASFLASEGCVAVSIPFRLQLPRRICDEMVAHARAEMPNECVGLLAGVIDGGMGRVVERFPLVNAAASPREFLSQPESMFAAYRAMRERGLDILAIYHSHPASDPVPSRSDLERSYSAEVVNFIVSLRNEPPLVRGWWLREDGYRELEWYWIVND